jgi:hypothetical protein
MDMVARIALAAALLTAAAALPADAAPPKAPPAATPDGEPVSCLSTAQIRETRVRDDRTIDFYTSGGKVYRNTLPYSCPELGAREGFGYSTSTGQLCSVDIITVLRQFGGTPQRGASCGLGRFQPVTIAK